MMKFRQNIRFRFLLCLILISVLPTLVIFLFTYHNYVQHYTDQVESVSNREIKKITASIDRNFKNIDYLETALLFSQYDNQSVLISICDQERKNINISALQRLQNYRIFEYVCKNLIGNNDYAEAVYLFTDSGYTYSFSKNREFWLSSANSDNNWKDVLDEEGDGTIIQPFVPLYSSSQRNYLLFAKKFKNLSGKASGTLAVICNDTILSQLTDTSSIETNILYSDGNLLYSSDGNSGLNLTKDQTSRVLNEDSGYIEAEDKHVAYAFGTLQDLGWKVVSKISLNSLYSTYTQSESLLLWVLSLVLIVAVLFVLIAEKSFVRPLVSLTHSMRKMPEKGMKFENPCPNRQDEIGILYQCFAKMLQQIQTLIDDKYKSEIRYLKSCLQSLMSQINAHFLFNTLENINCCAEIEQNKKIAIMSKSLGDILRYSIDYETDEVPLRKEVEQTQKYINIQEIKFDHPIQFTLDIEEGLLDHIVMKFLMQPIVENAIEHGLSAVQSGELILKAYHREDTLYLCIENNGLSIEEERLAEVREKIYNCEQKVNVHEGKQHAHIGLFNIHQRIQLLYSSRYGLTIGNRPNGGVVVQVTMPYHAPRNK